jgi:hypothetical protein
MNRKNKFIGDSIDYKEENQHHEYERNNSSSFRSSKKENIINDLKQKGFNKEQIEDIFETFIRNSINDKYSIFENNNLNIQETRTIDTDAPSRKKMGMNQVISRKNEINNYGSKYKNSFIIKTESSEIMNDDKDKSKQNCMKLYINASSKKERAYFINSFQNLDDSNSKGNLLNIKQFRNAPQIATPTRHSNILYSKKINPKNSNHSRKICSLHMNMKNDNNDDIFKKMEDDINYNKKNQRKAFYNNYNFKMIYESKKLKENIDNIGISEKKNNSSREPFGHGTKPRNVLQEEDKSNNSNNSISVKKKLLANDNKVSLNLNEIQEEKENYETNNDHKILNAIDVINNDEKKNEILSKIRNKTKFNTTKIIDLNVNKEKIKESLNNKYIPAKNIFSLMNNNSNKEEINSQKQKKNSVFMIRKQRTEEEEKLAHKNIAIVEIKQNENQNREKKRSILRHKNYIHEIKCKKTKNNEINEIIKYDKSNKSKSLSKINNIEKEKINDRDIKFRNNESSKRSLSNFNHNFVNINLCKDKRKNSSIYYKLRGLNNRGNYCPTYRNNLELNGIANNLDFNMKHSFKDINQIKNNFKEKELIHNKISKSHSICNDLLNFNKGNHAMHTSYSLKGKKKETVEDLNSIDDIIDDSNNESSDRSDSVKTEENLNVYKKEIKKYPNGVYEGIMLDDKREIKGTMLYSNGAKYDGEWKNDKKNGKGVFTSSHYYNCRKTVGMKYEGEFKDDKFDGYGITTYTNGDRYEGEWKNSKQYGKGTVSYLDGSKYEGEWVNGHFQGLGTFYLKNGEKYEGRFFDNKYNGFGKYYYKNGDYLEGIFRNDHPRGICILHKKDGTTVEVQH